MKLAAMGMIGLAWSLAVPVHGQRVSIDAGLHWADKAYVEATGEATVSAKPDQAVIEIGVISQGPTAVAVATQNAKQTDLVLADLTRLLGGNKQLRTTNYSVRPNYQYPKPGAAPTITGYTATNVVEATLDDLGQVSKLIDSAAQSGANLIQKLQYQLKNPSTLRAQALRGAAENAKRSAEAMASGLGLKVVRVLSVQEVNEEGIAMYRKAAPPPPPPGTAPATPLEIGMIESTVNVVLRAEIEQ